MSGAGINLIVKTLAEAVDLDGGTAHSLHVGPVTAAARVPHGWIACQSRWAERSTAIDSCIRHTATWSDNLIRHLGL